MVGPSRAFLPMTAASGERLRAGGPCRGQLTDAIRGYHRLPECIGVQHSLLLLTQSRVNLQRGQAERAQIADTGPPPIISFADDR